MTDNVDVAVIGSGMGALSAAALLAQRGLKVHIFEQNYLPGGCTSAYWRKGFVFEAGATTLVGLDEGMPLRQVLDRTGISLPAKQLTLPMQVHLSNGQVINRYQDLEQWIQEAERVFGPKNQRAFWEFCYRVSQFVWDTSVKQVHFPPSSIKDLLKSAQRASLKQVNYARYALFSMKWLLEKYDLLENQTFVDFVDEQLLITAQNQHPEVNVLFGATALCYTNYGNYYLDGGLISLVQPFVDYVEAKGGKLHLRTGVKNVANTAKNYLITTDKGDQYSAEYVISGIPINNTLPLFEGNWKGKLEKKLMVSEQLNSAFQMGIGFKPHREFEALHHQIHLDKPLAETGSHSIFISLSDPDDTSRSDEPSLRVMSISTHVPNPSKRIIDNEKVAQEILKKLFEDDILLPENIIYQHHSGPKSWQKWTGRAFGFVGGYPQFKHIKPWQMLDARLDGHKAYICGDTTYPGQGIPGVTLSGLIAFEKLKSDWL